MAEISSIQWTETTWNPLAGCTRASPGCDHCYAAAMSLRLEAMAQADIDKGKDPGAKRKYIGIATKTPAGVAAFNGKINLDNSALDEPCSWKRPRRIFVNSMSDLFHKDVPDEFIDEVMLTMAVKAPRHIYQVLTKRPDRAARYFSELPERANGRNTPTILCLSKDGGYRYAPPKNIWIGTSAESQQWYDERVPHLLLVPAAVRFLSLEPLLGEIDLRSSWAVGGQICHNCRQFSWYSMDGNYCPHCGRPGWSTHTKIHWVICGGESGLGARPMRIDWVRAIVGQCKEAQTAVFVKQLGASPLYFEGKYLTAWKTTDKKGGTMEEWPTDLQVRQFPQVKVGQMELLP